MKQLLKVQVPKVYRSKPKGAQIRTDLPDSPNEIDHEVWINGRHGFTINPHLDVCDERCRKLKKSYEGIGINLELVRSIGEVTSTGTMLNTLVKVGQNRILNFTFESADLKITKIWFDALLRNNDYFKDRQFTRVVTVLKNMHYGGEA